MTAPTRSCCPLIYKGQKYFVQPTHRNYCPCTRNGMYLPRNTITQHTTTHMSRRRPTLQRLWPSLSMGRLLAPPTNGAAASYWSHARLEASVALSPLLVPSFGAPKCNPSKNRERGGALALGGCRLMMANNNQLGVGGCGRRGVGEEVRWAGSAWGDLVSLFRALN
jgi:hypothetical protein